jgi:hypothetical protein
MLASKISLLNLASSTPGPALDCRHAIGPGALGEVVHHGVVVQKFVVCRYHETASTNDTVRRQSNGVVDATTGVYGIRIADGWALHAYVTHE